MTGDPQGPNWGCLLTLSGSVLVWVAIGLLVWSVVSAR